MAGSGDSIKRLPELHVYAIFVTKTMHKLCTPPGLSRLERRYPPHLFHKQAASYKALAQLLSGALDIPDAGAFRKKSVNVT